MANGHDSFAYAPRGLDRDESARYVGVSPTKFDQLVKDGRMPKAKRVDGRVLWDRLRLDAAFTDLPEDGGNKIDQLFARRST